VIYRNILWVDCSGAAAAGVAMLALSRWLSQLYGLPREFVLGLGVVNLIYGAYSFSLAVRARRPRALIALLVVANTAWTVFCLVSAMLWAAKASVFGLGHLVLEGLYVGWLASVEWRQREQLADL
jgi:hypothetical protein